MTDIKKLAASIADLVRPDMKPKDLIAAVRKRHPKAAKKDMVRAAFLTVIESADEQPERARQLQAFALSERSGPEDLNPDVVPAE